MQAAWPVSQVSHGSLGPTRDSGGAERPPPHLQEPLGGLLLVGPPRDSSCPCGTLVREPQGAEQMPARWVPLWS